MIDVTSGDGSIQNEKSQAVTFFKNKIALFWEIFHLFL